MTLFGSLRRTTQDQKDHSSDDDDNNDVQLSPLLAADPTTHPSNNSVDSLADSFTLRIKLNNGKSTIDYTLSNISRNITVSTLKESILKKHFAEEEEDDDGTNNNNNNRYLRLIVRGRMMAPDTSHLDKFSISNNDVIHAVLAKEGARGGQQARMLRRINNNNNSTNNTNIGSGGGRNGGGTNTSSNSPWRRIGIDQNGVVIPRPNDNDVESDDDDTSEDDFEDANGEIDLEGQQLEPQQRRRRRRERRGFDRLRAVSV